VDWIVRRQESRNRIRRALAACAESQRRYLAARQHHLDAEAALQASHARYLEDLAALERELQVPASSARASRLLGALALLAAARRRRVLRPFKRALASRDLALMAASPAPRPASVVRPRPLAGLHVLLVDDTPIHRLVGSELLRRAGASVSLAEDGIEAVRRIVDEGERHDAIVMDIDMPGLDGYAATRAIRAVERTPRVPIIAMSADVSAEACRRRAEAGMDDSVAKPLNVEQLLSTLTRYTGREASAPRA
jgi:CheY-like chemotaxis protein